jgi:4-diphosphocytidyl-2C-methyl-D-erythritol kinase
VPFFLAGGPAVVEGRGERVAPLARFAGAPPGFLLVAPGLEVSTQVAFAALDADSAAGAPNRGATRLTSEHLAAELRPGHPPLSAADLVSRAGVLAVANDLANAADILAPGLRALRRRLTRFLGVPIGLSGSGPTLWALYPSLADAEGAAARVRAELELGTLDSPGAGLPFVAATTIATEPPRRPQ